MNYHEEKAKRAYQLYMNNKPFKKVYAAVEKDGKFLVLKNAEEKKYKYSLAGGSVEETETNFDAIRRELLEELNVNVEIIKSLGKLKYKTTWHFENKTFDIDNEAEVFLTKFVSFGENKILGLEGEFENLITGTAQITKEEMLENVYEFVGGGINL